MLVDAADDPGRLNKRIGTMKIVVKLSMAACAVTAALCFDVPVSRASFGDAPWCVVKLGDDAYWDCEYRSSQDCVQALQANRGFCNLNPSPGPAAPAATARPRRRNHRSQ
jgi:hypothetical protein